jgi:DNA invertase Pin-like site-specific DNA recombinase
VYLKPPESGCLSPIENKGASGHDLAVSKTTRCVTLACYANRLYARVSTKDKGQDHENQLRELREFVSRKTSDGWILACDYVDKASGNSGDRPAFRRLFEDASRKEFDLVLFWSLDRFSREGVLETLQHLQRLSSNGVEWFSYREEYLRSIGVFKEAVLAILAAIAKQERIRLSERVQAGLSRARAQGKVLGRPRAVVRLERVLRLKQRGLSIRRIARETGVSAMTVQRILAANAKD